MSPRIQPILLAAALAGLLPRSAWAGAEDALLDARDLGGAWQVVGEAPTDPGADPDLVAWGVRAQHARHYTRDHHGRVQVCSVEIWSFASEAQASAAEAGFHYPDWQIHRVGESLVMLRGLVLEPAGRPRRGVFPECGTIGARVLDRAAQPAAGGAR